MAYLSRYSLKLADIRALRLTDTYSLHRMVYSLFENVRGDDTQSHNGILFADKGGDARARNIIILSDRLPNAPEYGTLETRPLPDTYLSASAYRFEITINPVRRANQSGKLIPVVGREAVATWFCDKAPGWGFNVLQESLLVAKTTVDVFFKGGHQVTLNKATLTGYLDVTDQQLFMSHVLQGIGRARSFGCGLLQIVPAL